LRRYRDWLYAMPALPAPPNDWQTPWRGEPLPLPAGGTLALSPPRSLPRPLQLRYRRGGERFRPAHAAHTRELRLLLQEAGIPPWRRAEIPLILRDGEILAVGDLFLSVEGIRFLRELDTRIVWTRAIPIA
jgi:tRNA(Ile)-lysidine synthase